ncbi:MAG: ferritin family protein [Lachnospiraceae bacterium]|nr:ferritin family protein [Lachnospiraceae bacterium]
MEEKEKLLTSSCSFRQVKPILADLPYPPTQVQEKNPHYAGILGYDYCGQVSEMSAIMQYINCENRLALEKCSAARVILGIAMAEMIHLQKLGELITLLGGTVSFAVRQNNGRMYTWTPEYLNLQDSQGKMIAAGIESEKAAIRQYRMHIKMIRDPHINAVLSRIIQDEEYHIMLLQALAQ